MFALFEQRPGQLEMRGRGRDDAHGVAGLRRLGHRAERAHAVFLGNLARGLGGDIINPDKIHLPAGRQLRINARMLLAQRAGAEHGHSDFVCVRGCDHPCSLPPCVPLSPAQ